MASRFLRSGALALLALGLAAFIPACGDEDVPAPTTPAPTTPAPTTPPAPAPEPPAVPGGLRISATGPDFIEWSWTPVSGATGYDVQYSANETFGDDEDEIIARTAEEISYRKTGLESGTRAYLRVRAAVGAGDERITGDWSTHLTGMAEAPPAPEPTPEPPVRPTGLDISDRGPDFIEWSWSPVSGASGYDVQYSANEAFTEEDDIIPRTAEEISYRKEGLEPETRGYLRVRAAAGTGDARVTSAWTDHRTGMTTAAVLAAPSAPTNLRTTEQTATTITWTWNAVEGAVGYQVQLSESRSIPEDTDWVDVGRTTTYTAPGLPSNAARYLRVRAYVGTSSERVPGEPSETVEGRTVRVTLGRPTGLETGTPRNTTIPLSWDPVTDAGRYEVQQNPADGNWTAARCGTGGSFVTNEQCVASSLTEGTNYQFRVRAQPDSGDDTTAAGPWSLTASAKTTGRPPFTVEEGGLNLRWSSEFDRSVGVTNTHAIAWTWDPVEDRAAGLIDHYVALLMPSGECPSFDQNVTTTEEVTDLGANHGKWLNLDSDIAVTVRGVGGNTDGSDDPGALGEVRGLCVVRTWEDNRGVRQFGDVSLVWGTTNPDAPTDANPSTRPPSGASKESIGWAYEVDEGFTYALRLLTVSRNIGQPSSDPADCADGTSVTSPGAVGRLDVPFNYRKINPDPYTYNQLCIRAENDYGQSEWTFVGADALYGALATSGAPTPDEMGAAITKPAAPTVPRLVVPQSSFSTDLVRSQTITRLVYSVSEKKGTPSLAAQYETKVIRRTAASVPRGQTQATCNTDGIGVTVAKFNTNTGVEFEATGTFFPTGGADEHYFHLCVRADPDTTNGNGDEGPWSISSPQRFVAGTVTAPTTPTLADVPILDSNGAETTDSPRKDRLNLSWTLGADEHRSGFEVQYAVSDIQITTVGDNPTTGTVSSPTTMELVITGRSGQYVAARVRSYQAFGQNRVYSTWTSAATRQIPTQ